MIIGAKIVYRLLELRRLERLRTRSDPRGSLNRTLRLLVLLDLSLGLGRETLLLRSLLLLRPLDSYLSLSLFIALGSLWIFESTGPTPIIYSAPGGTFRGLGTRSLSLLSRNSALCMA
mmetsp:Transcript_22881/g.35920  ORF Transcript_22881/g.35920 Transcript_22881/m.35920 type:complete len:118 (-) Transcript_22881:348-701(-)